MTGFVSKEKVEIVSLEKARLSLWMPYFGFGFITLLCSGFVGFALSLSALLFDDLVKTKFALITRVSRTFPLWSFPAHLFYVCRFPGVTAIAVHRKQSGCGCWGGCEVCCNRSCTWIHTAFRHMLEHVECHWEGLHRPSLPLLPQWKNQLGVRGTCKLQVTVEETPPWFEDLITQE